MIPVLIFDLDDTLYDEIDYCRSGHRTVANELARRFTGHPADEFFSALWAEFTGGNTTATFNGALEKLGIAPDSDLIRELVRIYREHTPDIVLPEDSSAVLAELKSGYKLSLLTDGFLPAQRLKVEALGIAGCFSPIIYTEALGREYWKPSPAGFLKIAAELGVSPSQCAYIADNELKDFIAPNSLGMTTVKVVRANSIHRSPSPVAEGRPAHIAGELANVPRLLESL